MAFSTSFLASFTGQGSFTISIDFILYPCYAETPVMCINRLTFKQFCLIQPITCSSFVTGSTLASLPSMQERSSRQETRSEKVTAIYLRSALTSVAQCRALTHMNLCWSVNSEKKYLQNNFLIWGYRLLEANSRCQSTPIKLTRPCDLNRANARYPCSSMAPEALSGSTLSCEASVCFEDITIRITSATLPASKTA